MNTQCEMWQRMTVQMETTGLNVEQLMLQNNSKQLYYHTTRANDNDNDHATATTTTSMLLLTRLTLVMTDVLNARLLTTTTSSTVTGRKHPH